jgi:hypothetical protein
MLYNLVSFEGLEEKTGNSAAILRVVDTKPADFFLKAVRHMVLFAVTLSWTADPWSEAELEKVLRACKGVVNLFFVGTLEQQPGILLMLEEMRPRRMIMIVDTSNPRLDLTLPFFQNITHLLLDDATPMRNGAVSEGWPQLRNLTRLSALTHLALDEYTPRRIITAILADSANLRALIIHRKSMPALDGLHDPCLVLWLDKEQLIGCLGEEWQLGIQGALICGRVLMRSSCARNEERSTVGLPLSQIYDSGHTSWPIPIWKSLLFPQILADVHFECVNRIPL